MGCDGCVTYLSLDSPPGRESGLFIRGRCHSRLLEMKLGLCLDRGVPSQRKSSSIIKPSVAQLGAANPMLLS